MGADTKVGDIQPVPVTCHASDAVAAPERNSGQGRMGDEEYLHHFIRAFVLTRSVIRLARREAFFISYFFQFALGILNCQTWRVDGYC